MFEPPTEEPYSPSEACHTQSFCPEACKETVNTSFAQNEEKTIMNVDRSEPEDNLGSKLKSKQTTSEAKDGDILHERSESTSQSPSDHTGVEGAGRDQTEGLVALTKRILEHSMGPNLEKMHLMSVIVEDDTDSKITAYDEETTEHMIDAGQLHCSDILQKERQYENTIKEDTGLAVIHTEAEQRENERELLELPRLGEEQKIKSAGKCFIRNILSVLC